MRDIALSASDGRRGAARLSHSGRPVPSSHRRTRLRRRDCSLSSRGCDRRSVPLPVRLAVCGSATATRTPGSTALPHAPSVTPETTEPLTIRTTARDGQDPLPGAGVQSSHDLPDRAPSGLLITPCLPAPPPDAGPGDRAHTRADCPGVPAIDGRRFAGEHILSPGRRELCPPLGGLLPAAASPHC